MEPGLPGSGFQVSHNKNCKPLTSRKDLRLPCTFGSQAHFLNTDSAKSMSFDGKEASPVRGPRKQPTVLYSPMRVSGDLRKDNGEKWSLQDERKTDQDRNIRRHTSGAFVCEIHSSLFLRICPHSQGLAWYHSGLRGVIVKTPRSLLYYLTWEPHYHPRFCSRRVFPHSCLKMKREL